MADDSGLDSVRWERHWLLESGIDYLDHGAFGASPKRVLKQQSELRRQMERQPVRFMDHELPSLWNGARGELADFVGAKPEGMVFVPNATTGVNAVLRSLEFDAGDEILVTDHTYEACRRAVHYAADRARADVTVAKIPFPIDDASTIVERVLEATTPRTEFALLDHVTSPTGLVVPVERLVDELHDRHVDVMVDGAHAPGMLDLDVETIGAEYYTGNCHKWLCAPKGAAFLHVDSHHRDEIHPLAISKGHGKSVEDRSTFHLEFDWTGTDDPTPYLCVPTAIEFLASLLPEGWDELRRRNHKLALRARDVLCDALDLEPPAPDEMLGSMAALPLPEATFDDDPEAFENVLSLEHGFEVPVKIPSDSVGPLIRVSAQLYNTVDQYRRLADTLLEESS